mgnify:CR=1 FL=1
MWKRNPDFLKEITTPLDPYQTLGLFYVRSMIIFDNILVHKRWKKTLKNNKLIYVFDAIWKD